MKKSYGIYLEESIISAIDSFAKENSFSRAEVIENILLSEFSSKLEEFKRLKNLKPCELSGLAFFNLNFGWVFKNWQKFPKFSLFLVSMSKKFKKLTFSKTSIFITLKKSEIVHEVKDREIKNLETFLKSLCEIPQLFEEEIKIKKEKEIEEIYNEI